MNRWAIIPRGRYPKNWDQIAKDLKKKWDHTCERCGHIHEISRGYCLTVHHIDGDKANCLEWNLAVLCQRCHLKVQAVVSFEKVLEQMNFPFYEIPEWFRWHLKGYIEFQKGVKNEN